MNFETAISHMREGSRVTRGGWKDGHEVYLHEPFKGEPSSVSYFLIETEGGDTYPWLATHADLLADDWEVITF